MRLCSCTVSLMVLVGLFATSTTSPANRLAYYQQPSLYYQSSGSPQQLIYLQYVQQPQSSSSHTYSRLSNAAYEFVASEAVVTGTRKEDEDNANPEISTESVVDDNTSSDDVKATDDNNATDIPEANVTIIPESNQVLQEDVTTVTHDISVAETTVEYETEPDVVPTITEPSDYGVTEDTDNFDDSDTAEDTVVLKNASEVTSESTNAPLSAGTFFPIQFKGPTNGGAIAIANSFSTGEGGSATSHAIAYGQPNTETS